MPPPKTIKQAINKLAHELARSAYEHHRQGLTMEMRQRRQSGESMEQVLAYLIAQIEQVVKGTPVAKVARSSQGREAKVGGNSSPLRLLK